MRRDKNKDKDSPGHPGAQSALHMGNHRASWLPRQPSGAQSALHMGNHGASWLPRQPSGLLEGSWTPLSLTLVH